eukprot:TRINITY_DN6086_c0_g1_i1.p1 TRINITY_DN6086_c0_g1~~TRINITY_DN6086_c0_g1_i1.p1  ORF type:complete len:276 (-),score=45.55 TRINITY_DN6086_c0_g1_i1:69-896(-)
MSDTKSLVVLGAVTVAVTIATVLFFRRKSPKQELVKLEKETAKQPEKKKEEEKKIIKVELPEIETTTKSAAPSTEDLTPSKIEAKSPPPVESQSNSSSPADILGYWVPTTENPHLPNYEFLPSGTVKIFTRYEYLEGDYTVDTKSRKVMIVINLPAPLGKQTIPLSITKSPEGEVSLEGPQSSRYRRGEKPLLKVPKEIESKSEEERYAAFVDEFSTFDYPQPRDETDMYNILQQVYQRREELLTKYGLSLEAFSALQKSNHPLVLQANKKLGTQ